jgi:iron complex outermembrane receptor protein
MFRSSVMRAQYCYRPVFQSGMVLAAACTAVVAWAQVEPPPPESATIEDITVTARRTVERSIAVPVIVSSFSAATIANDGITDFTGIAVRIPSLVLSNGNGAIGGSVTLRGISSGDTAAGVEQAVQFNIDGIPLTQGIVSRFGQHDLERVEVLEGPQALFFGKNSIAGIISVVSADPTDKFESSVSTGYEFKADEVTTDGYVSGPLSDDLKVRVAYWYSHMQGYFRNPLPEDYPGVAPGYDTRLPETTDWGGRATVVFQPSDRLSINVKGSLSRTNEPDPFAFGQPSSCPGGVPLYGVGDCVLNGTVVATGNATPEQLAAADDARFRNGRSYADSDQDLVSAKAAYQISDALTLSSITGYYYLSTLDLTLSSGSPVPYVFAVSDFNRHDFTQEVRLESNYSGFFNFKVGVFYQNGAFFYNVPVGLVSAVLFNNTFKVDNNSVSEFAQSVFKITDTLELTGGGRYTSEERKLTELWSAPVGDVLPNLAATQSNADRFTPEVTLSYRPNRNLTLYAAYKEGFQSGGFDLPVTSPPASFTGRDLRYMPETVHGEEIGLKTITLENRLRFELAAFNYTYDSLQVSSFNAQDIAPRITNAASARTQGIEANFEYAPPILGGLKLHGAGIYVDAKYLSYPNAACYTGQTIQEGCNQNPVGNVFVAQDLSGRVLPLTPKWSGNIGVDYDTSLPNGWKLGLGTEVNYSGNYNYQAELTPHTIQNEYALLNARIRLASSNEGWELALIGTNLTNKIVALDGLDTPLTPSLNPAVAGTGTAGPGVTAVTQAFTNRPVQVMLRLTIKPNHLF